MKYEHIESKILECKEYHTYCSRLMETATSFPSTGGVYYNNKYQ